MAQIVKTTYLSSEAIEELVKSRNKVWNLKRPIRVVFRHTDLGGNCKSETEKESSGETGQACPTTGQAEIGHVSNTPPVRPQCPSFAF
jgi:hypothetical protein